MTSSKQAHEEDFHTTLLATNPALIDQTTLSDRERPRHAVVERIARDALDIVLTMPESTLLRNVSVSFYYSSRVENALFSVTIGTIIIRGSLPYDWTPEAASRFRERFLERVATVVELQTRLDQDGSDDVFCSEGSP
jgi:hypothetical protein